MAEAELTQTEEKPQVERYSPREEAAQAIADARRRTLGYEPEEPEEAQEPEQIPSTVHIAVFPTDPDGFVADVPSDEVEAAGGHEAYAKAIAAQIKQRRADGARIRQTKEPEEVRLDETQEAELARLEQEYPDDVVAIARRQFELQNRTPDVDAIAEQVITVTNDRMRERRRVEANSFFVDEFNDIEHNPDLKAIANRRAAQMIAANPDADYMDIARDAGQYAGAFRDRLNASPSDLDQRRARKRNLSGHSPPATTLRSGPPLEAPAQTRADVIAEMRRSRGQPD